MKKQLLTIIITAAVVSGIVLFFINLKQKSSEKYVVSNQNIVESENANQKTKEQNNAAPVLVDESEMAKSALVSFFDYLSKNEFEKALALFSLNDPANSWEGLASFSSAGERNNKAKVLENYCKATGTCLKAKVLNAKKGTSGEYNLVVQFLNSDGSVFVQRPCCGATEETMPSKDRFDYTVKKINNTFKVLTAPLYRP